MEDFAEDRRSRQKCFGFVNMMIRCEMREHDDPMWLQVGTSMDWSQHGGGDAEDVALHLSGFAQGQRTQRWSVSGSSCRLIWIRYAPCSPSRMFPWDLRSSAHRCSISSLKLSWHHNQELLSS